MATCQVYKLLHQFIQNFRCNNGHTIDKSHCLKGYGTTGYSERLCFHRMDIPLLISGANEHDEILVIPSIPRRKVRFIEMYPLSKHNYGSQFVNVSLCVSGPSLSKTYEFAWWDWNRYGVLFLIWRCDWLITPIGWLNNERVKFNLRVRMFCVL